MAVKLCAFVIEGRDCRREMREEPSDVGARGFVCPLGHRSYETQTGSEIRFRREFTTEVWHFSADCSQWPERNFSSIAYISSESTLCNECIAKGWVGLRTVLVSFLTTSVFA
jgi:hypothetical protein